MWVKNGRGQVVIKLSNGRAMAPVHQPSPGYARVNALSRDPNLLDLSQVRGGRSR